MVGTVGNVVASTYPIGSQDCPCILGVTGGGWCDDDHICVGWLDSG